ncbi:MAG: vWA domain-containing protein, partial [Ignavibacteria bacterium]
DMAATYRERTPLNIAVVIDKSGSMGEKNKIGYVKKAVDYIIEHLDRDDYISIVTYDTDVNVLQSSTRVRDKYDLREKVSRIYADGWTNLSEGMFEGYDQVNDSYSKGYVNRVLLLSDGLANRGITDRWRLADMVRDKNRRDGIVISTFGVGNDFNEDLMADIADYGKGNYYYIRNSSDIPEIFANELKGVRNLVGQGTRIKVRFPDNYLSLNKVYGYPYDVNGDEVTIDFKDVFSEQSKSVLLKFDINKQIDRKIEFESELSYEDVSNSVGDDLSVVPIREMQFTTLELAFTRNEYEKGYDETVRQNIAVFESNEIMENALREADNGNYDRAREQILTGKSYMNEQMQNVQSSPEMKRQLETMEKYNEDLESAETKSEEEKKEMQKSGKFDNYKSRKGEK